MPVMSSPRVSVITAVYNPPRDAFEATVASVLGQTSSDWEWILTDDCSPQEWVVPRLRELAARDSRVTVQERAENGGIVAASNDSLAAATGEFVALLDHDDVLEPNAVAAVLGAIDAAEDPEVVDYVYSDQGLMTEDGRRKRPYRKPDWSPERFRHHMYTTHFSVLRRSLVVEVGGFRSGFDGSQDHDLVLRVTEKARMILHVPEVLYHWRAVPGSAAADPHAKPYAWTAGVRAVQEHLDRLGIDAEVTYGAAPGLYDVKRRPDLVTSVSVIIPTIGTSGMIWGSRRLFVVDAVRSVLEKSEHENIEFVIVYDSPTPPHVLRELRAIPGARLRMVEFKEKFNFSAKCNVGVAHASGDILLFLNDDVEAVSDGLVESLIAPLKEPDVGATGARLLFEDGRIQHAGVIYGSGTITHHYYRANRESLGNHGELVMNREASALTGACLAMRREVFEEAGGFTERLPGNYNDVDLCLKLRHLGYRLVWMHDVTLYHFESITRERAIQPFETKLMDRRWGKYVDVEERYINR
jgi:GT2 family glycosyltransferase